MGVDLTIRHPTEGSIQRVVRAYCRKANYIMCSPNSYGFGWESDLIAIRQNGLTAEFEIKVSRMDFEQDLMKTRVFQLVDINNTSRPNFFYYVCPRGLIQKEELFPEFGLFYADKYGLTLIKRSKKLHENKISHENLMQMAKSFESRYWQTRYNNIVFKQFLIERGFNPSEIIRDSSYL